MNVRSFLLSLVGVAMYDRTLHQQASQLIGEIRQSARRTHTFASALIEHHQPPAALGQECDFAATCPFRASAQVRRRMIRRLNTNHSSISLGPKDSP